MIFHPVVKPVFCLCTACVNGLDVNDICTDVSSLALLYVDLYDSVASLANKLRLGDPFFAGHA